MYKIIVIKVLLIVSEHFFSVNSEILPNLSFQLKNAGFHRDLEYMLKFQGLQNMYCEYTLVQNLSSAIYVNLDQLNDLKRFNKIQVYVPSHVDVELTTEKADPITLFLYGQAKNSNIINLPIHFRYHSPDDKKFVKVTIDPPTLLIKCSTQIFPVNNSIVKAPCSSSNSLFNHESPDICEWQELEYINNPLILNAIIPVGNRKLWFLVTFGTLTTSWLGCIFIVYSIHQRRNLIKKL